MTSFCKFSSGLKLYFKIQILIKFIVERMDDKRRTKGIYRTNVCARVVRGYPWRTFIEQISDVLK